MRPPLYSGHSNVKDVLTFRHREGGIEKCRKLFYQAVNSVNDDVQRVCEAYLQFEREEGTLESFEAALTRVEAQMGRIRERQEKVSTFSNLLPIFPSSCTIFTFATLYQISLLPSACVNLL